MVSCFRNTSTNSANDSGNDHNNYYNHNDTDTINDHVEFIEKKQRYFP